MALYKLVFTDTMETVPPLDMDRGARLVFVSKQDAEAAAVRHTRIHERPCAVAKEDFK